MHKTALRLDEDLLAQARAVLGTKTATETIHTALAAVAARQGRARLFERLRTWTASTSPTRRSCARPGARSWPATWRTSQLLPVSTSSRWPVGWSRSSLDRKSVV